MGSKRPPRRGRLEDQLATLDRLLEDARRVQQEVTEQLERLWRPRRVGANGTYTGPERRQWPRGGRRK